MNNKIFTLLLFTVVLITCESCSSDDDFVPKPPTYLRLDIPKAKYVAIKEDCPFQFEIPDFYKVNSVTSGECHKDIDLGPLNGVIHFSYIKMIEPLSAYVNYAIDKVDEHKIKASSIDDSRFIDTTKNVFGTLFELKGDVASPFQFYLTEF